MRKYYEVLWYTDIDLNNYETRRFGSKKQALAYYERHKEDIDTYCWWVTYRDADGFVLTDIIY